MEEGERVPHLLFQEKIALSSSLSFVEGREQALESASGFAIAALGTDAGPDNPGAGFLSGTLMRTSPCESLKFGAYLGWKYRA